MSQIAFGRKIKGMSKAFEIAKEIFLQHNGILRSAEARRLGIHPQTLSRMLEAGLLVKEERGLYRLVEIQLTGKADLIQVAKLVPDESLDPIE